MPLTSEKETAVIYRAFGAFLKNMAGTNPNVWLKEGETAGREFVLNEARSASCDIWKIADSKCTFTLCSRYSVL